jgi:hypothetical protein
LSTLKERFVETQESEQHQASPIGSQQTRIRFIEELAGPEDRWVTITDAARITRTSEAMARRWVTSGRLPIKRLKAGVNQQTRLVRLSDVAAIRPIIDPLAAISDAVHTVDLPSIPRQQAFIMQDHERLQQQVRQEQQATQALRQDVQALAAHQQQAESALREQGATRHEQIQQQFIQVHEQQEQLGAQVREQRESFQEATHCLAEQANRVEHDLAALKTTALERFTQMQHEVEQRLLAFNQQSEQVRSDVLALLQQYQEHVQATLAGLEETLTNLKEQHEQLEHAVATHHHALAHEQKQLHALIEQREQEVTRAMARQEASQKQEASALQKRLLPLERWREHCTAQAYDQRLAAQEQRIQVLTVQLQEERAARLALGDQLEAVPKLLEALRRESERRGAQPPETEA